MTLGPGRTLELKASPLTAVFGGYGTRMKRWGSPLDPNYTALDLVALAIQEVGDPDAKGSYFDVGVLGRLLEFEKVIDPSSVSYELRSRGKGLRAVIDTSLMGQTRRHLRWAPPSGTNIVTGHLEEISQGGCFRLRLGNGDSIRGQINQAVVGLETLRELWGNPTTIHGMTHFRAAGRPRFMEVHRMEPRTDRDAIFDQTPMPSRSRRPPYPGHLRGRVRLPPEVLKKASNFKREDLWGRWPGDETVEELLAMLDSMDGPRSDETHILGS